MAKSTIVDLVVLFYNLLQISGWSFLLFESIKSVSQGNFAVLQRFFFLKMLEIIQTLQYCDLIFSILKISQTKFIPSLIHVSTRTAVVWFIFPYAINSEYPVLAIIPWALGDLIRFSNYINSTLKMNVELLEVLRYNAFLILYPLGLTGEWTSAGAAKALLEKVDRNITLFGVPIQNALINYLTVFRIIAYPGLGYMYWHMIKLRKKYYSNKKAKKLA